MNATISDSTICDHRSKSHFTMKTMFPAHRLPALAASVLLLALLPSSLMAATAEPPSRMTFQSYLTDSNGDPVTSGNQAMTFRIYNNDQGSGSPLWIENQTVAVNNGYFSVILGEVTELPSSVFQGNDASDRYIEIEVGSTKLKPLMRLLPSPYAFLASQANKLTSDGGVDAITLTGTSASFAGSATFAGAATVHGNTTLGNAVADDVYIKGEDIFLQANGHTTTKISVVNEGVTFRDTGKATGYWFQDKVRLGNATTDSTIMTGPITAENDLVVQGNTTLGNAGTDTVTISGSVSAVGSLVVAGAATLGDSSSDAIRFRGVVVDAPEFNGQQYFQWNGADFEKQYRIGARGSHEWLVTTKNSATSGSDELTWFWDDEGAIGDDPDPVMQLTKGGNLWGKSMVHTDGRFLADGLESGAYRQYLVMNESGDSWNLRVNTSTKALNFFYNSEAEVYFTSDGHIYADLDVHARGTKLSSDRRLKKDIESIGSGALEKISRLRPVQFHFKDETENVPKRIGYIAQEVQEILPEVVETDPDGMLAMSYEGVSVVAVSAIQELKQQNDQLKSENEQLKQQFADLLSRLQTLESKVK